MSYQALARKWRPTNFDEVVGQDLIVKALSNALNSGRLHHAYLFVGTRGVGKTTLARILAKALNCGKGVSSSPCGECLACSTIHSGSFSDLIEIDAASKTGVDDTREILENVQYAPTSGRYKVYLIDEVHMFSKSSFNALLKTLEEPPEHVKFLLATTNAEKLPVTILSRCIQLRLQRVEENVIEDLFKKILSDEKIECDDTKALKWMAKAADGSIRDGLSLLDQSIALGAGSVKQGEVSQMLGLVAESYVDQLVWAIIEKDGQAAIEAVGNMLNQSGDYANLLRLLLEWVHQLALVKHIGKRALHLARVDADTILAQAEAVEAEEVQMLYELLQRGQLDIISAMNPKIAFEMLVLRLIAFRPVEVGAPPNANSTVEQTKSIRRDRQSASNQGMPKTEETISVPQNNTEPLVGIDIQKPTDFPANEDVNQMKISDSPTQKIEASSSKNEAISNNPSDSESDSFQDLSKNNWSAWLQEKRKGFSNIVWQYLRNSQLEKVSDSDTLTLGLKQAYVDMCNDIQKKQIAEQLSVQLKRTIRLHLVVATELANTLNSTLTEKALKMIEEDTEFQKVRKKFDLKLDESSVRIYDED